MNEESEPNPAVFNFPPPELTRWSNDLSPGVPPLREQLTVNDISLGMSKSEVLGILNEPDETLIEGSEYWTYHGTQYGFNTRAFVQDSMPDRNENFRPLTVGFNDERVSMVAGGILKIDNRIVAQFGKRINNDVLVLGKPAARGRPSPPHYQNLVWDGDSWNIGIDSERLILGVRLSEPWWPPEEGEDDI